MKKELTALVIGVAIAAVLYQVIFGFPFLR